MPLNRDLFRIGFILLAFAGCVRLTDHTPLAGDAGEESEAPPAEACSARTFPTLATTGWAPTGVTLTTYTGPVILSAPVVIEGADITGCLSFDASNITIRRSRIRSPSGGCLYVANVLEPSAGSPAHSGILLEDVELDCGERAQYGLHGSGITLRRVSVHGCITPFYVEGLTPTVIEGSAFTNVGVTNPANPLSPDGVAHLTVRASSFEGDDASDSAIYLHNLARPVKDTLIWGNYVNGGGFTLRAGSTPGRVATQTRIIGNCWGRRSVYGPVTDWDPSGEGNVWLENNYLDTGEPVPN